MSIKNMDAGRKGAACETSEQTSYRSWMGLRNVKVRPLVIAVVLSGAFLAVAQRTPPPPKSTPSPAPRPGIRQQGDWPLLVNSDPNLSPIQQQMKQQRNALRGRLLLEKAARLQKLSDELKADIDKTDGDTLPVDVIRKSEKIEKLAKSIHEMLVTPL